LNRIKLQDAALTESLTRLEIVRRPEVIRKIEPAGFAMLLLGIESAQDKTLRAMLRGFILVCLDPIYGVVESQKGFLPFYFTRDGVGRINDILLP